MQDYSSAVIKFLSKNRIAVAGVSRTKKDAANFIYKKLKETGYEVFAVNPNADKVEGDKCYRDLKSIPNGVEAVVIVTNPEFTLGVVKECADVGINYVWMHKSFGNSSSFDAVQFCRDNGITVIPGGCPMMHCEPVDFGHKCIHAVMKFIGRIPKKV